jgi:GT2 family glycosyltransferase
MPSHNLGVAGSWNWLLGQPGAYHLIVGSDVEFSPGDLAKLQHCFLDCTDYEILCGLGYSLFILRPGVFARVGSFDENFYPAYLEDCDYNYRSWLSGVTSLNVPGIHAVHGEAPLWGSSTIYSNPGYLAQNSITHRRNLEYYRRKWGGDNGREVFTYPFNDVTWPVQKWVLDPAMRKANDIWPVG